MRVVQARRRLGLPLKTTEDQELRQAVRDFQAAHGLIVTGDLDEATFLMLDAGPTAGEVPVWYQTDGQDEAVAARLGGTDEARIRRFQSALGLPTTGLVDEATAVALGD